MVGLLVDSNVIDSKIVWPGEVIKVDSLEAIRLHKIRYQHRPHVVSYELVYQMKIHDL